MIMEPAADHANFPLYFAFLVAAHRAFCAMAILARASALRVRFPAVLVAGLVLLFF